MAIRRAKTLDETQFKHLLKVVRSSEHSLRDEVALRLSFSAGLRAAEIANLRWRNNLLDASLRVRDDLHITSDVGKRAVERTIPLEPTLKKVLQELHRRRPEDEYVFYALHNNVIPQVPAFDKKGKAIIDPDTGEQAKMDDPDFVPGRVSPNAVVQWFKRLYAQESYDGCSSHSGRRTFITIKARSANQRDCSIRDVQLLAGHRRLESTAEYIDPSDAQRKLVSAW